VGGVVDCHIGMIGNEVAHELSLVSREVVDDDMDFAFGRLTCDDRLQEGDEFGTGVSARSLTDHLARL
jgi:hypothetical protein